MTQSAIRIEELWKEYRIGGDPNAGLTLRESIVRSIATPLQRLAGRGAPSRAQQSFWALQGLSFEIEPGEVVGIIGRNGAGKSTLLKILSRITAPSKGRVEIRGRVASLLEVGTGFHPELTGRENIRLNAAILGMPSAEIARKFDEIVAFSGVEKFIDTPVKRFSSGMQVRLAFAVAAHLDPEILIVDEVLAVGDAEFQRKCLGKMSEVAGGGRTVIFVSHQLGMIAKLCSRAILLGSGKVVFDGPSTETIETYLASTASANLRLGTMAGEASRALPAYIKGTQTIDPAGNPIDQFGWNSPVGIQVHLGINQLNPRLMLGVGLDSQQQGRITTWVTRLADHIKDDRTSAAMTLEFRASVIAPGRYGITVALFELPGPVHQNLDSLIGFHVVETGSAMAEFGGMDYGVVIVPGNWTVDGQRSLAQVELAR